MPLTNEISKALQLYRVQTGVRLELSLAHSTIKIRNCFSAELNGGILLTRNSFKSYCGGASCIAHWSYLSKLACTEIFRSILETILMEIFEFIIEILVFPGY